VPPRFRRRIRLRKAWLIRQTASYSVNSGRYLRSRFQKSEQSRGADSASSKAGQDCQERSRQGIGSRRPLEQNSAKSPSNREKRQMAHQDADVAARIFDPPPVSNSRFYLRRGMRGGNNHPGTIQRAGEPRSIRRNRPGDVIPRRGAGSDQCRRHRHPPGTTAASQTTRFPSRPADGAFRTDTPGPCSARSTRSRLRTRP
jgi:hypothetical protein